MRVVATAGHVDHGKSTLIRRLTGMEPDRWDEERRRGLTIDLGFAWTELDDGCSVAFVDVPGHERFVPNMLAGIGPVPAVLLVVAADEGWMPQSEEHLDALHALGVDEGLLVITRSDLADPREALEQARDRLRGTSLADIPAVQVSGHTGAGLDELAKELDAMLHRLPPADLDADVRLWIDRAFAIKGAGTVVTGTLQGGTLRVGDRLSISPAGLDAPVRALHALGSAAESISAPTRVAVNLRGIALDQVRRGHALLTPGRWWTTDVLDARIHPSSDLPQELTLHIGAAAVTARVRPLGADTARLTLRQPLPLRIGDRALLRDPGGHQVRGGVTVLDVRPPQLRRRGAARARAEVLAGLDGTPDGLDELNRRGLVRADELAAMGATPPGTGPWLMSERHRAHLAARLREVLAEHRRGHPLDDGMPAAAAVRALRLPDPALLPDIAAEAQIPLEGGRLDGGTGLPATVARAVEQLRTGLREHPFRAPTAEELGELGIGDRELAAAERTGALLRLGPGLVLLPDAEHVALPRLAELDEPFTLSEAKRALDTSRRVAVPLLELLARRGHTQRLPDGTHRLVR
ncbi:selenocysteine-specific translation elongation factor [Saccharopolyspora rhizosphaerae]|uniref:Selenocysteine-specific translation elongation factor n=1 Tax=Saccharopolyspora rhizosphaerae TaxID=2492662 RepID=A0A3R8PB94_9PSEU|nr:selenocysteine-specific translation elongation factor [Saccharopolyspora rhizosphaerae]RRO20584.1 selenocysteine-specific translation elongation factor [Saccharopolyspora rhizosphaerae]